MTARPSCVRCGSRDGHLLTFVVLHCGEAPETLRQVRKTIDLWWLKSSRYAAATREAAEADCVVLNLAGFAANTETFCWSCETGGRWRG